MPSLPGSLALIFALSAVLPLRAAEEVAVAAAANLAFVLGPLDQAFSAENPGVSVTSEIGSSGSLVAQIENGAPYDVFLAADMEFPRKLLARGGGAKGSLVTYAYGKLVLWTMEPGRDLPSVEAVVRDRSVRRIAIANPRTAPYGRAAEEVLAKLRLSAVAGPKIVIADNISQAAQFVSSGNVEAGFVALSLVEAPNLKGKGRWRAIPDSWYSPIAQGAVLTTRGSQKPGAYRYLAFLTSPTAQAIFRSFGYRLPARAD